MIRATARHTVGILVTALLVGGLASAPRATSADHHVSIDIKTGHSVLEVIGEVNNFAATTEAPLGLSQQFGYVSDLDGLASVFTDPDAANQNEGTAALTFFTNVTTTRVTSHGPFSIVIREGTTIFYRAAGPSDFSNPATFQSGDPILWTTMRQQVILDTVAKTFTVVNLNTITATKSFTLGGDVIHIGEPGDMIRTSLVGVLRARDGVPPPTGHFAGSGVGISREGEWR